MKRSIAALFQRLTQGVYVVGVAHGAVRNAFTAAWVMQVSFDPLLLTLSINPHHSSVRTRPTFLATDACFGGIYGLSFAEATKTSTAIGEA